MLLSAQGKDSVALRSLTCMLEQFRLTLWAVTVTTCKRRLHPSADVDEDVDLEAERFATTSRGTGKRLSRGRGGGRGNGSTRKFKLGASTAAGQAANKALNYMLNASKVQKKTSVPAQFSRCWSWDHWRPADTSTYGDQPVSSRYEELLKTKPKLQCCHCQTQMSWNPSTKRKQHLLANCAKFRL
jgi:hypothetical protein